MAEDELSITELSILVLIGRGCHDPQIAARLCLSERGIDYHLGKAMTKLESTTRAQACVEALVRGYNLHDLP